MLILKHAQGFYGADLVVSHQLTKVGVRLEEMQANPGEFRLISSEDAIAAEQVLFVGVEQIVEFGYTQIRHFSKQALNIAATETPNGIHIAMTIHGVGYGLDEQEAFISQLSGLLAAIRTQIIPVSLKQITIVERDQTRVTRLKRILNEYLVVE